MWRHTRVEGGGFKNVTTCNKDGGGVKKSWNSCDVIYGWPLIIIIIIKVIIIIPININSCL